MVRRNRAWDISAGVQVGDIEAAPNRRYVLIETERQEQLQVVGQTVGKVREHAHFHVVARADRRPRLKPAAHFFPLWQSPGFVTGVRRAHGHLVAALHEPAREAAYEPWYPSVRPGVSGVGRDVKDSQTTRVSMTVW